MSHQFGATDSQVGVTGASNTAAGVVGDSATGNGVEGRSDAAFGASAGAGVLGECKANIGVKGVAETGTGLNGVSKSGFGVAGESETALGVIGISNTSNGVEGRSTSGHGVFGQSQSSRGVGGISQSDVGVFGVSTSGVGVWGKSDTNEGVHAQTNSLGTAAVAAYNDNPNGAGAAIFAKKEGNVGHAGFFDGDVFVTGNVGVGGDITLVNADCAEEFDIAAATEAESGVVMVLDEDAKLQACRQGYDRRVAGVVSGAGDYRPGIVLGKQHGLAGRAPIALLGKVFCKVDAGYGAIAIGDMLTTSPTPGHAMKATDPHRAFGAVIGKALRPLSEGRDLIPILITLQ